MNRPYHRMPGPGDLPGNGTHPHDPSYVEPAFGMDDAARNVGDRLAEDGESGVLVELVIDARGLLGWISQNVELPLHLRDSLNALSREAGVLGKAVEAEYEALNAPGGEL